MEKTERGFWAYVDKWRHACRSERIVQWDGTWLRNDYCADCRYCCGKQDSPVPFPMPLLPRQTGAQNDAQFHMQDCHTAYLAQSGCLSDGPRGCKLTASQKPVACGLFPITLVNGGLYLYQNCPAAVFSPLANFLDIARQAAAALEELPYEELLRLSLWFLPEQLAKSYIDLRIKLFTASGKKTVLE